ncbi:MAG TPA: GNAT family N-acetyltransferase [Acidimicrobiia bacterium]|nr:GNAT family N-acetyltransferase [Acidimicrobiia bacterium]
MASLLRIDGSLPAGLTITAGWFKARVRPWNDTVTDPMVRLIRGGAEFLRRVSHELVEMGASTIYSPALFPDSTRVWEKSGFHPATELALMERSLLGAAPRPNRKVIPTDTPDWEAVLVVDRAAFEGFWGMSALGLREAFEASRSSTVLQASIDGELTGYALVGNHWSVSYLHRIAVHPHHTGQGIGFSLLSAGITWGRAHGARSMVLNVRDANMAAQRLYQRSGFTHTGTRLKVLRRPKLEN